MAADPAFNPYEDLGPGPDKSDREFLKRELDLTTMWPEEEATHPDWNLLFRDPDRTLEFAEYYFSHPELPAWTRFCLAEILVNSAVDFIDPRPIDDPELSPASEDVAVPLVQRLVEDTMTRFCLAGAIQLYDFYPRLKALAHAAAGGPVRNVFYPGGNG